MPPETISESDYQVLGLRSGAKPAEIKRAYRGLAKKWHPDRYHSASYEAKARAEEKFREINEAYERLIKNWWRGVTPAGEPESAHAGADAAWPTSAMAREHPFWQNASGIYRRFRASLATRIILAAAIIGMLLLQARNPYWSLPPQVAVVPPAPVGVERGQGPASPAFKPPEAEPSLEKLLSEIIPPKTPASPLPQSPAEPTRNFFTIGSPSSEVLRLQGKPSRIQGQTWLYGLCEVQFRSDIVWRYNNFDGSLKVRMLPRNSEGPAPHHFTIGSSEDDVLLVQGTPTRIEQGKWFYGFAEVRFKDGRVKEYDNYFGSLRVRLLPAPNAGFNPQKYFFSVGSTPDEVLAVQGTPTTIQGNVWSYDFSYVFFRDGRVNNVSDSEGKLRFILPEDIPNSSAGSPAANSGS